MMSCPGFIYLYCNYIKPHNKAYSRGTIKPESWGLIIRTGTWLQQQNSCPLRSPALSYYQFVCFGVCLFLMSSYLLLSFMESFCKHSAQKCFELLFTNNGSWKAVCFEHLSILCIFQFHYQWSWEISYVQIKILRGLLCVYIYIYRHTQPGTKL